MNIQNKIPGEKKTRWTKQLSLHTTSQYQKKKKTDVLKWHLKHKSYNTSNTGICKPI